MINNINITASGDDVAELGDSTGAFGDEMGGGIVVVLVFAEVEDDDVGFLLNELVNEMAAEKAGATRD